MEEAHSISDLVHMHRTPEVSQRFVEKVGKRKSERR